MDYVYYWLGYEVEQPVSEIPKEPKMITKTKEEVTYVNELKDKLEEPNKGLRKTDNSIMWKDNEKLICANSI